VGTGLELDPVEREPGAGAAIAEHVTAGKRQVVTTILRAEVSRLARLVPPVAGAEAATR